MSHHIISGPWSSCISGYYMLLPFMTVEASCVIPTCFTSFLLSTSKRCRVFVKPRKKTTNHSQDFTKWSPQKIPLVALDCIMISIHCHGIVHAAKKSLYWILIVWLGNQKSRHKVHLVAVLELSITSRNLLSSSSYVTLC